MGKERGSLKGITVLVCEDNKVSQMLAQRILEKHGYKVLIAADGKEGIEAYCGNPVSVVIMDLHMPEKDGFETAREIRAIEARDGRRRVLIAAMSASSESCEKQNCLDAGMDAYIAKPIRIEEIERLLMGSMEKSAVPPEGAE
ncbi:MAG: response regulator [Candidatus Eremiobacteraeota bacterium]|nr:response regulator [Candidatus Eremiobacteraeota bacterium]